ncbi:hypothetical protein BD408DRAFT_396947 [Parasitella parasitica]|nr:hypothetical protein BD408DRAFT_396947 [Parasitella parasitica]
MTLPQYYAREATANDLKFAEQATDVLNAAYHTEGRDLRVVGSLLVVPFPDLEEKPTPGEAMITRFSISPAHQSKGLGSLLIKSSLETMKSAGYERCSLRVFENRHEILEWYAKLGFKDTSERRNFKAPHGKKLLSDTKFVIMKKDI